MAVPSANSNAKMASQGRMCGFPSTWNCSNSSYQRLGEEAGSVVVIDVHTGEVLSLVSAPSFDPNLFNLGLKVEQWRTLTQHPRTPLVHRAISGQYAPGSTFKMIVALAALEAGVISPDHRVFCAGKLEFGRPLLPLLEKVWAWRAVAGQCDRTVLRYPLLRYRASRWYRPDQQDGDALRPRGSAPASASRVKKRVWCRAAPGSAKHLDQPWHQGETLVTGIGQGYLLATPLQLAVMVAQIANGGFRVKPTLIASKLQAGVRQVDAGSVQEASSEDSGARESLGRESLGLSAASLTLIHRAMDMVSNSPFGARHTGRAFASRRWRSPARRGQSRSAASPKRNV